MANQNEFLLLARTSLKSTLVAKIPGQNRIWRLHFNASSSVWCAKLDSSLNIWYAAFTQAISAKSCLQHSKSSRTHLSLARTHDKSPMLLPASLGMWSPAFDNPHDNWPCLSNRIQPQSFARSTLTWRRWGRSGRDRWPRQFDRHSSRVRRGAGGRPPPHSAPPCRGSGVGKMAAEGRRPENAPPPEPHRCTKAWRRPRSTLARRLQGGRKTKDVKGRSRLR